MTIKAYNVNVCRECLNFFKSNFFESKEITKAECFLCRKKTETQNFVVNINPKDPIKEKKNELSISEI